MENAMELFEMTWPMVAALSKDTPVVIPIAALEQHGRHMPVFTDSMLLGEVLRRVKETPIKDRVLFTPRDGDNTWPLRQARLHQLMGARAR